MSPPFHRNTVSPAPLDPVSRSRPPRNPCPPPRPTTVNARLGRVSRFLSFFSCPFPQTPHFPNPSCLPNPPPGPLPPLPPFGRRPPIPVNLRSNRRYVCLVCECVAWLHRLLPCGSFDFHPSRFSLGDGVITKMQFGFFLIITNVFPCYLFYVISSNGTNNPGGEPWAFACWHGWCAGVARTGVRGMVRPDPPGLPLRSNPSPAFRGEPWRRGPSPTYRTNLAPPHHADPRPSGAKGRHGSGAVAFLSNIPTTHQAPGPMAAQSRARVGASSPGYLTSSLFPPKGRTQKGTYALGTAHGSGSYPAPPAIASVFMGVRRLDRV